MKRSAVTMGVVVMGLVGSCAAQDGAAGSDVRGARGIGADDGLDCGSEHCVLSAGLEGRSLCCMDPFEGGCGVKTAGTCRPLPAVDLRCPVPLLMTSMVPPGATMTITGCCTESAECGIDFGLGCQPRSAACELVGPSQVAMIMPMTCDGVPLPLPADCGRGRPRIPPVAPPAAGSGSVPDAI